MAARVAQPPINPHSRASEQPDFWTGLIVVILGMVALYCGATHVTDVDTTTGETAWEYQLVKAVARGGLLYSSGAAPLPDPSVLDDPMAAAAAFSRLDRLAEQADQLKYRVDVGAAKPCPT